MIRLFEQFGYMDEHKCHGLDPTSQRLLDKELPNRKTASNIKTIISKVAPAWIHTIN